VNDAIPEPRRRALNAVVALAAIGLVVGGTGFARALTAQADNAAPPVDAHLLDGCGADVVVVVERSAAGGPGAVVDQVAQGLAGSTSRLGVVVYDDSGATPLTAPPATASSATSTTGETTGSAAGETAAGPEPEPGQRKASAALLVPVDAAANAPGGPIPALVAALAEPAQAPQPLEGAVAAALAAAGARPVLILHVAATGPTAADGSASTTSLEPATPGGSATQLASAVAGRPATRLLTVAPVATGLAGAPGTVVDGARLVEPTDRVLLVPSRPLAEVAGEVASDLCATAVRLSAADAAGLSRAGAALTVRPDRGTVATPAPATTDSTGAIVWRIRAPLGTPFTATVVDGGSPGGDQTLLCAQDGASLVAGDTALTITGITPGRKVTCELRAVASSARTAPLTLAYTVAEGDLPCGTGAPAALVTTAGTLLTHCLTLTAGDAPVSEVAVTAPALGVSGVATWQPGLLRAGTQATHRVVSEASRPLSVDAAATGTLGDTAVNASGSGTVSLAPAALTVERWYAPTDPTSCRDGAAAPTATTDAWCVAVSNTGGTHLDELSVQDAALAAEPLALAGRLAPGARTVLTPKPVTPSSSAAALDPPGPMSTVPVASGRPIAGDGEPLGPRVTSAPAAGSGLVVEQRVSGTLVATGEEVTATVTVTNSTPTPRTGVSVRNTLCGPMGAPASKLGDNGDAALGAGEAWVYTCSAPVVADTVAMAIVTTQDDTSTSNSRPDNLLTPKPELRLKKRLRNDLRVGSETRYEIEVINNGNGAAPNTVITDQLPPGTTFVRTSGANCSASGTTVRCSLGTVPPQDPGQETIIQLFVNVSPAVVGQVLANTASVSTSALEVDTSNNTEMARGRVFAAGECGEASRDCPTATGSTATTATTAAAGSGTGGSSQNPSGAPGIDQGTGGSGSGSGASGTGSGSGLVRTGTEATELTAWALVLVASGVTLVAAGRRRQALVPLALA
jgi:uncharacterized repeat protein (TIGR01451 family)